jgi:hypothetical protein
LAAEVDRDMSSIPAISELARSPPSCEKHARTGKPWISERASSWVLQARRGCGERLSDVAEERERHCARALGSANDIPHLLRRELE